MCPFFNAVIHFSLSFYGNFEADGQVGFQDSAGFRASEGAIPCTLLKARLKAVGES
jgi:hypothetical protein